MIALFIHILASSTGYLLVRGFRGWGVVPLYAITINYVICIALGASILAYQGYWQSFLMPEWLGSAFLFAVFLIGTYLLIEAAGVKYGVGPATLVTRLSVVIPVLGAFLVIGDELTSIKLLGIGMALVSLYLALGKQVGIRQILHILPITLFISYGTMQFFFNWVQVSVIEPKEFVAFLLFSFVFSLLIGTVVSAYRLNIKKHKGSQMDFKIGALIGFINFTSITSFLFALEYSGLESSVLFPVTAIAVIVLASLGGRVFYKEKLVGRQFAGLALGILAIVILF